MKLRASLKEYYLPDNIRLYLPIKIKNVAMNIKCNIELNLADIAFIYTISNILNQH